MTSSVVDRFCYIAEVYGWGERVPFPVAWRLDFHEGKLLTVKLYTTPLRAQSFKR